MPLMVSMRTARLRLLVYHSQEVLSRDRLNSHSFDGRSTPAPPIHDRASGAAPAGFVMDPCYPLVGFTRRLLLRHLLAQACFGSIHSVPNLSVRQGTSARNRLSRKTSPPQS